MPPSAMTGVLVAARHRDGVENGRELRHADAGDDARGADRARPDADFDGVGAGIDQRLGAFGGRDVAGNDLHRIRQSLDARHGVEHLPGMAMRGVDHDKIDAGFDQPFGTHETGVANRGRGRDPQPALLVLAGKGIGDGLLDVLDRDQSDAAILRVDHQQLLDAVLMQEPLGLLLPDAFADRDELFLGHQFGDASGADRSRNARRDW